MNFLAETLNSIEHSGHSPEEIVFIGSRWTGHSCTWEEFQILADKEYDNSYGAAHVAVDLIIAFTDGQQLTRGEYDGQEWWQYNKPFVLPKNYEPITKLVDDEILWETLEDMNNV